METAIIIDSGETSSVEPNECQIVQSLYSPGFFGGLHGVSDFFIYVLPRIQFQLALIFLTTQALHLFFRRFGIPRIIPEMLVLDLSLICFLCAAVVC